MSESPNPLRTSDHPLEPLPLDQHPWVTSLSEFRAYYRTFFQCILSKTFGFFGWNKRTLLVPVLFVLGFVMAYFTLEGDLVRDELLTTIAFVATPVALLTVVVALVNIVRAPWLLDSQRRREGDLLEDYKSKLATVDSEKQSLTWRTFELEKQIAGIQADRAVLQKRLRETAERLLPKFQILFEYEPPFVEERTWADNSKRRRTYIRIKIVNDSAKTIENVSVTMERFIAFGTVLYENLPLRMMNNDSIPPRKSFSLHPEQGQFMELASKDSALQELSIGNAYEGKRRTDTEEKDITVCVVATGLNAVPVKRRFRLYVDADGVLHCEPLDPVRLISFPSAPLN